MTPEEEMKAVDRFRKTGKGYVTPDDDEMMDFAEGHPHNLPHNRLDIFDPDETFSDIYPEEREDDMGETSYHTKLMASLAQGTVNVL